MIGLVETTLQDVRYALRSLGRSPGFAITAICTLALGIGANTAIFSIVSGVLLRPLPFTDPGRLFQLSEIYPQGNSGAVFFPDVEAWRAQSASFESIAAYGNTSRNVAGIGEPEQAPAVAAERGLFRMLGVEALAGRTFRDDDSANVVVLSSGFARRHFADVRAAIGRTITLDAESFTVIGVMPEGFQFPYSAIHSGLWIPWDSQPQLRGIRNYRADFVVARLRPGVNADGARAELETIARRVDAQQPGANAGRRVRVTPLLEIVAGSARDSLLVLLAAVGLVLLVACVNVANLLLARGELRMSEVAIRAALGAGRARLVRQFVTESLLLALGGGLLGLAVAKSGTGVLTRFAAAEIPRAWEIDFDWRVFLFLLTACIATGIGFGLAPALVAARSDVQNGLRKMRGRGPASARFRDALVVAEIAMAFVLLAGAGLLLRAFLNLQGTPTGLAPGQVLTLHLAVSPSLTRAPGAAARYCYDLEERISRIPGVRSAGFISFLPLQNSGWTGFFSIAGRPDGPASQRPLAELRYVSPGYFRALGIPLRQGRLFSAQDSGDAPRVVLINEALARRYFPGEDPVGRQITGRGMIAGVVGDVRQSSLDQPAAPEIYYPMAQNFAQLSATGVSLVVSSQEAPETVAGAVRTVIRGVDPNQAVFNIKSMPSVIADSLSNLNLYLWLIGIFAAVALVLACAGIYGVISYAVASRTREFGIRMALGAGSSRTLALVLGHAATLIGLGLAAGLCGALSVTRILKSLLYGVSPADPVTFAAISALLALVALAASWIPARRAMLVDPAVALRYE